MPGWFVSSSEKRDKRKRKPDVFWTTTPWLGYIEERFFDPSPRLD
jgi:hypothetical protein